MNVVWCTDNQFLQVEVSMCSLFENTIPQECNVYLLTNKIEPKQEQRLNNLATQYGAKYRTIIVDEKLLPFLDLINDENGLHQGLGKLLPNAAYYRWLIPYYLKGEKRCLYVDTDVVFNHNIQDIYDSIEDEDVAIVGDNNNITEELVSGSLFINIDFWNNNHILYKCITQLIKNHSNGGRVNDQHILNIVTKMSQKKIDNKDFSCLSNVIRFTDDISNFYLIHYCDVYTPWTLIESRNCQNTKYWWKYCDIINNKNLI